MLYDKDQQNTPSLLLIACRRLIVLLRTVGQPVHVHKHWAWAWACVCDCVCVCVCDGVHGVQTSWSLCMLVIESHLSTTDDQTPTMSQVITDDVLCHLNMLARYCYSSTRRQLTFVKVSLSVCLSVCLPSPVNITITCSCLSIHVDADSVSSFHRVQLVHQAPVSFVLDVFQDYNNRLYNQLHVLLSTTSHYWDY